MKTASSQRAAISRWQAKMQAKGLCVRCGQEKSIGTSRYGARCLEHNRQLMAKKRGSKRWNRRDRIGRPPMAFVETKK
jgi:hypothetical protein